MEKFQINPLSEGDIITIIEECGGEIAHPEAHKRQKRGADFIFSGAVIELKMLDENGFEKSNRQEKLAEIFNNEGFDAPVIVLDRAKLTPPAQRLYDRAVGGPIKTAISSARKQLKQTRQEKSDTHLSILWIVNNGYTALNHEELTTLVASRVRNDTSSIDGVIVSGCYFHSDGFDSFFLWPITYVPIQLRAFSGFDKLHAVWDGFAEKFMTRVMLGELKPGETKGPVIDTQFELGSVTYVKPAPPIGGDSDFFVHGRPRKDSSCLEECPPVALTFPGLSEREWHKFKGLIPNEFGLRMSYEDWLLDEECARSSAQPSQPFVRMHTTFEEWKKWCDRTNIKYSLDAVRNYANGLFLERIQKVISTARPFRENSPTMLRYILVVTDEIGQDKANDLSHIAMIKVRPQGEPETVSLFKNLRIIHEYAIALASAYAIADGIDAVMWIRKQEYMWA